MKRMFTRWLSPKLNTGYKYRFSKTFTGVHRTKCDICEPSHCVNSFSIPTHLRLMVLLLSVNRRVKKSSKNRKLSRIQLWIPLWAQRENDTKNIGKKITTFLRGPPPLPKLGPVWPYCLQAASKNFFILLNCSGRGAGNQMMDWKW